MTDDSLKMNCGRIVILTALLACVRPAVAEGLNHFPNRNLFIGNSLTGGNHLPAMVGQIRSVSGEPADYYQQMAVVFGVGLDHHWFSTEPQGAHDLLNRGGWDGVVLQDLSFNATDAPNRTRSFVRLWDAQIKNRSSRATTFLFAHWERQDRPGSIAAIDSLYGSLGAELDATVVPVGRAWENLKLARPDIQLYTDPVHPTQHGSYLAAAVFYASIYGQSPVGFAAPALVSAGDASDLQAIAWDLVSGRATAVDRGWEGQAGGQWNDPANWGGGVVPSSGDRLSISPSDGGNRVINYANPAGASTLLGNLTINATSGSITIDHQRHTLRMAGNLVIGDGSGGAGNYLLQESGKLFVARDVRLANGSFVQQGGKQTVIGKVILGGEAGGSASYTLENGLLSAHIVEVRPGATFTQTGGSVESERFDLVGGKVAGVFRNKGLFNYFSGQFDGKLVNEGTAMLRLNSGKIATSEAGASVQLEVEVAGGPGSLVVANANQDLRGLMVRYQNPGSQGFDLASGIGAGEYRSIRIYPGDAAAIAQAEMELSAALGHALVEDGDGIFDSGLSGRIGMRVAMARRVDVHSDSFLLLRPTVIGDLNIDGRVSISDFIDLAANFGSSSGTWERGDINYDGDVTIADFIELAANFGASYSGEAVAVSLSDRQQLEAFAAVHVPEPTVAMFLLALWYPISRRRLR